MEEKNACKQCDALGVVRISDEVVANIAGIAALEIEGVVGVAGSGKQILTKNFAKAVRVEMCERIVSLDMALVIKYGYSLPETGMEVQDRVKSAIESMTGLEVADVNIRIEGIDLRES